jgi:hypothetical protein
MILFITAAIAGLLIALGGLALVWQRKMYIDVNTNQVTTKIDLPFGIKLQTNAPAIAIIFMGVALILITVMKNPAQNFVAIQGHVSSVQPLKVYAIAAQGDANGDFLLQVPGSARYTVMYLPSNGANAIDSKTVDLVDNHQDPYPLPTLEVQDILAGNAGVLPVAPVHTEPSSVISEFK